MFLANDSRRFHIRTIILIIRRAWSWLEEDIIIRDDGRGHGSWRRAFLVTNFGAIDVVVAQRYEDDEDDVDDEDDEAGRCTECGKT